MTTGEKVIIGSLLAGTAIGAVALLTRKKAHASVGLPPEPPVVMPDLPSAATVVPRPPPSGPPQAAGPTPPVVEDDVEALARVLASESSNGIPDERLFIAWAVRNRAARRRVSIKKLVCSPHCGPQSERINGKGVRPMSSRRPARPVDRELARFVLSQPASADPTGGATSFIEPQLQDELHRAGRRDHRPYAEVRARWMRRGEVPLGRVGRFEFWRHGPAPAPTTGVVA